MNLILIAGYKPTTEDNVFWLEDRQGLPLLERRIREARELTARPVVVLSGAGSDLILRGCRSLEHCELIFDTNGNESTVMTNVRAALMLGPDPAIIHPTELPFGTRDDFQRLRSAVIRDGAKTPDHLYQAIDAQGDLLGAGFPLIVTCKGRSLILAEKDLLSLADPRLHVRYIAPEAVNRATPVSDLSPLA